MSTSPILPTIGRIVLVRLICDDTLDVEAPAVVNGVYEDRISATVFAEGSDPNSVTDLFYVQEDDVNIDDIDPIAPGVWRWMPYQLANDPQSKSAQTPA